MKRLLPIFVLPLLLLAAGLSFVATSKYRQTQTTRQHFDKAARYVAMADGPQAEAEWLAILQDDPRNVAAQELLAEYYLSRQQWKPATAAFAKLHELAPGKEHILCKLAACKLRLDDQKGAYETAQKEIERSPRCIAALGLVTSLMANRPGKDGKQLLTYLRRLVELQPDDVDIHRLYAETLTNEYMYDELRPVLQRLLQLSPDDVQAYNLLGLADLARPDQPQGAQDAITHFRRSLQVSGKTGHANGGAHLGLGRAYLSLRAPQKAVAHLETAARLMPHLPRVMKELAGAYQKTNQPERAQRLRSQLGAVERRIAEQRMLMIRCSTHPQNPDYPRRLGELFLRGGQADKAFYYLDRAARLRPADPGIQRLLAQAREQSAGKGLLEDKGQ